jgi:hypothetical protein
MSVIDRRDALALFGLTFGAEGVLGSAVAQEMVQADTKGMNPPARAANIEPASHVNGEYHSGDFRGRCSVLSRMASVSAPCF